MNNLLNRMGRIEKAAQIVAPIASVRNKEPARQGERQIRKGIEAER